MFKNTFRFQCFALSLVLVSSILGTVRIAYSASGQWIKNNTPPFVRTAHKIGPAGPSDTIEITVWLNVHNRQQLDAVADDLYDPSSPHYRAWLKFSQIAADYAPTAEEAKTVVEFLSAHKLSIVLADPHNFFVKARGTVAQVSATFRVELSNFEVKGKVIRANTSDPYIEGAAAPLVHLVSGLSNQQSEIAPVEKYSPSSTSSSSVKSLAAGSSPSNFFSSNCFHAPITESVTTEGELPAATYSGNLYDSTNIGGCGYTPPEIHTAYNLSALYKAGYNGKGQTVVIFEICNTDTIQSDANAFSAQFGLPALSSANFSVIEYPVPAPCDLPDIEEELDVEWVHAIAPGANIVVLVTPNIETNAGFAQDVDVAILYATANHLGNVISMSYGTPEFVIAPADLDQTNLIIELAAASGISVDISSGDSGDYTDALPGITPAVSYPASSQYATAVGGTTLALNGSNAIKWQAGWGTNTNLLDDQGLVSDPPVGFFFGGSGGGPSSIFGKPSFQNKLPGSARLLPDIAWIGDPFTGVVIAITDNGIYPPLEWFPIGGTSVACPMFSGLWAIANQEAGTALGQAARYLYSMPASTITDIVPVGSSTNVTGSVTDEFGTTAYSASELAQPLDNTTVFYDALWNVPLNQGTVLLVTFGTDTHLQTAPGWDDVTGVGVPNPKPFADFFKP
ncbi:MAG: S53 family peptidase [Candidatus Sulfotelmatobacter sp.]